MSIYIEGIEMPKEGSIEIAILAEGIAIETGHTVRVDGKDYYTPTLGEKPSTNAIEVPDHGRLIDADEMERDISKWLDHPDEYIRQRNWDFLYFLKTTDTVIPASDEET